MLLAVCFGVIFIDMVGYGIISPSIPQFARMLSATDAQMGYAFAGYPVAFTVAILPLGLAVDRFGGNRLVIVASMLLLAVASVSMALASSVWMLVLARALQGLASASAWVATQPLVARASGAESLHSQEMSVITIAAGLGVIVGPLLGGAGELATPFLVNATLALLCGAAAFLFLPREGTGSGEAKAGLGALLRRRGIRVACLAIFCSCSCFGIMELLLPLHVDRLGYSKLSIGLLFGVFSVFYVAAQPLISRWIDRRGGYEPIYVAGIGLAVAMALVIRARLVWTLSATMAVTGVFSGALFLASMFVVARESPEGRRGSAYALWNLAFSLGYLVGPAAGGNLSSLFGIRAAFHVFAGFLVAGTIWIYLATARSARPV